LDDSHNDAETKTSTGTSFVNKNVQSSQAVDVIQDCYGSSSTDSSLVEESSLPGCASLPNVNVSSFKQGEGVSRSENYKLIARVDELEKEIQFQSDTNLGLHTKLNRREQVAKTFEVQLDFLKNTAKDKENQLDKLVQDLKAKNDFLSQQVKGLGEQLQFQASAHVDQFNELKKTEAELENCRLMFAVQKSLDAKEQTKLKKINENLRTEKDHASKLLKDVKGQLHDERVQREEVDKSLHDSQQYLGVKECKLDLLKTEFDSKLKLTSDLKAQVASAWEQNAKAEGVLKEAKSKLQKSEAEVKSLTQKLAEFETVKYEKDVAEEVLQDLRSMLDSLDKRNKELLNEKIELESKMKQLQESCEVLKLDKSSIEQQLADLTQRGALKEQEYTELSENCNELRDEKSKLEKDICSLKTENDALKKKADGLAAVLEELNETIGTVSAVRTVDATLMEKMKSLSNSLLEIEVQKSEVVGALETLRAEHESCAETIKSLTDKCNLLQTEKAEINGRKESHLNSLRAEHDSCKETIKLLMEKNADVEKLLAETESKLASSVAELETSAASVKSLTMRCGLIQKENEDLMKEKADLVKQMSEKESCWTSLKAEHQFCGGNIKSLNDQLNQIKAENAKLENEGVSKEKELKTTKDNISSWAIDIATYGDSVKDLEKQLVEAKMSLEGKTSEIESEKESHERRTEQLEKQIAESQKFLNEITCEMEMERKLSKTKMDSLIALNQTFQGGSDTSKKLVASYKNQLISTEEELKQSVSELKEAKRLLVKVLRRVRNDPDANAEENVNVILLVQDVSKILLVEFDRAEMLATEIKKLKSEKEESLIQLEFKVSELEKLKKTLRTSQAKLELEQMFLRECRSSLEAEQELLQECQSKLEAETRALKDCQSKLEVEMRALKDCQSKFAKEQTSSGEAHKLNKILQKNVDDSLKLMNDYKEKYQASEARFLVMRMASSSDYCTGSETSSGSSPVLDSGDNVTPSIGSDDPKALDLTLGRNIIKNSHVDGRSLDSRERTSSEFLDSDFRNKKHTTNLVDELNKELTLVQNENHYLEHCLKDLEKVGGDCRKRCQELSELNLNLVRENCVLCAKVEELSNRMSNNSKEEHCHEKLKKDEDKKGVKGEVADCATFSICKECLNLKQKLKCLEDTVKANSGCDDCLKLQRSVLDLEDEKQELSKSLSEMNQAYEQLAGVVKGEGEASPNVSAEFAAGKRKLRPRATGNLAQRVGKLDTELRSMRVKLDAMTDTKRKSEESLAKTQQRSIEDRRKLEFTEESLASAEDKIRSIQAELTVKKSDLLAVQLNLGSEIDCHKILLENYMKLKTKLENKDCLIEDLALELKEMKSKMTQQAFDLTDANSALHDKECIMTDLTYQSKKLCSNCSSSNVPRAQDVDDLKQYLKKMESMPNRETESLEAMKQLVEAYDSSDDEMEEVRSVRISSPRNIQHINEDLHEKDIAELKKHNRKLTELYEEQEKLIKHLSKEKHRFQEIASRGLQEDRFHCLEDENEELRNKLAAEHWVVVELKEKAQKHNQHESSMASEKITYTLNDSEITVRNLRGQLQVERLAVKSLKEEKNTLQESLEKSENEIKHLRFRLLDLSKSECEQKMEFALLQGDAKLWVTEKDRFQEVLTVSRNEVKRLESILSDLQCTVDDLRKEFAAERMRCATLNDEAKAWASEKRQLTMDLEVAENEKQRFQKELEDLTSIAKWDEGKVHELAQQVKTLQEGELELKHQIQVMESDVKDKQERIVVYEEALQEVQHLNVTNNINQQLEIVRNEKQQVLKVLSATAKEVALLKLDKKQQQASFKEALEGKENSLISLQSGITVLTKQLNRSRSKAVSLLYTVQEKETELRDVTKKFEAQLTSREETIASSEKKIKELEHSFEMLKNEHEIANITKALDENLVAELRRDFEVMEHKVAELHFQNTELNMKKTELMDKNCEFLAKIAKLEKMVSVKDEIMEACKEQLLLMSNQLDSVYSHDDAVSESPDLHGLAMKQAKLNEREAKLAEKDIFQQKHQDVLKLKEKEFEKQKSTLRTQEADLKKREASVANLEEEVRSKVKDHLNGCLSELQKSRTEEYKALDSALKEREMKNNAMDDGLKARELKVNDREADLLAREELLNGCHLEIQELAGAVTTLEGDVGTLKKCLYAKEASVETCKQTCVDLEKRLKDVLDELLTEKQKNKLRSGAKKMKSVKTMTDFEDCDTATVLRVDNVKDTHAKTISEPVTSAISLPEIRDVKSTETQTKRNHFGDNFCCRCGLLLHLKNQENESEDPDSTSKDVSDAAPELDCLECKEEAAYGKESENTDEISEVVMEAERYFVVTEPLKDSAAISQELCVANQQQDGTVTISPLKDISFRTDVAVLRTACDLALQQEAVLKEKFEELRSSLLELRAEMNDRESYTYKEVGKKLLIPILCCLVD
jgi:chromosome segregation ATPase